MLDENWVPGNQLWADFCVAWRAAAAAEQDFSMPRVHVNKLGAHADKLRHAISADAHIMSILAGLDVTTKTDDELAMLDMFLRLPIEAWEADPPSFLPLVGLTPEEVEVAPAFYFAGIIQQEWAHETEAGPYSGEHRYEPIDERNRNLHRVGGVPTRVPGVEMGDEVFLMQIDLLSLSTSYFSWRERPYARAVFEDGALPTEGVLQVFHTTTGDSVIDPHLPGGGARLIYLTEDELWNRQPLNVDTFDYPVSRPSPALLPTFTCTPFTSDDVSDTVIALQNQADRVAGGRGGVDVPQYWFQKAPAWSRMLGASHVDCALSEGDLEVLNTVLPLTEPDDRHVLLFTLASDMQFDGVFGDEGRLEIWLRRSDISRKDFSTPVSFLRNT